MKLREVIGPINSYAQNPAGSSVRLRHRVNNMAKAHDLNINEPAYQQNLRTLLENLKQKISALGARLRRYNQRVKRYKQNRDFQLNQKLFYRNLATDSQQQQGKPPEKAHMMEYWNEIWSQKENHNKDAYWLRNEEQRNQGIPEMERIIVTAELVRKALTRLGNWKTPGNDKIQAYWWKNFPATHPILSRQFQQALVDPEKMPPFFTQGVTYMLPKNQEPENQKNFRPITCLLVIYKILTSIINAQILPKI
ncbi:uncharacterized protein LOC115887619 [Sitophilus oryzae]|uniref:Uncharacterized protein LOC115887619 n=1 Tax=Sitophilus oryzae TaxID=7048 RepID=A0A6J2YII1_SITOR|nr:uncharacterized protein LOC115887619 [Sitophilus oryzae]